MARKTGKAKVLIIDDHPVVRNGLSQLICHEGDLEVCGEAGSASEALKLIPALRPDILLLDISLGETNGISLIKDILSRFGEMNILALSMHDESLYAERALRAGAKGYIMKEEATDKVIGAIRRVLRGEIHLSERMSTRLLHKLVNNSGRSSESPVHNLSDRELEVFELIGRGMSTRSIADKLSLSIKTIEAHRANLKRKLRLKNSIELLQYATQWVQDLDR
jgi:DNA-binding NarL/FixJ family response regulator